MNKVLLAATAALMTIGFTSCCNDGEESGRPPLSRWARQGSDDFRESKHLKRTDCERMRDCGDCNSECGDGF